MLKQTTMPKRIEMLYADAVDNLRFLKSQQWLITRYVLTAYAALFAIATQTSIRIPLVVAAWLVAIGSALMLHHFVGTFARFRDRIGWIYRNAFPKDEQSQLRLNEADDPLNARWFIRWFIAALIGGAAITTWAILCIERTGCLCQ